jgi:5-methyltetrahydrofolate--homocysteine methyltransferase
MGTTLSAADHTGGHSLELLNVEQPDLVRAAHRAFVEAGSELIQTNTFQGSRPALARYGLGDRAVEVNAAGAKLALELAGEAVFVAGSIGPTGKILEPYGDCPPEEARAAFAEQAAALADAGVDLFIVETFSALDEARLAVEAAAQTGLPIAASMAFDPSGRTAFGVTAAQAAQVLAATGAIVVGANCGTISAAEMVGLLGQFRDATELPLIAQPNAGKPQQTASGVVFPEDPDAMADAAERFRDLGAGIIGGCCGSSAAHIRAIARRLAPASLPEA